MSDEASPIFFKRIAVSSAPPQTPAEVDTTTPRKGRVAAPAESESGSAKPVTSKPVVEPPRSSTCALL
eukprot:2586741-Prymnesium_polylepis.1